MTVKVASLTNDDLDDQFEFETEVRLSEDWTEICPVCHTQTAEPMWENVFCHRCNRFLSKTGEDE